MSASKRASVQKKNPLDHLFERQQPEGSDNQATQQSAPENSVKDLLAKEANIQTTILVSEDQLLWLDEKCIEARRGGGKAVSKTAIIRALIDFARKSNVNLTGLAGEEELLQRIGEAAISK